MKLDALLLVAALAAAGSVQAQTPSSGSPPSADRQAARAAMLQACDADKSLCADKQGREVMMCLHSNADKLSAGCKDAMSKLRRPAKPAAQPQ
jgi:hypothetical protein